MKSGFRSFTIALTLLLTAIVLPLYGYKVFRKADYTDFYVYYRAATRAGAGAFQQVYTLTDGASPFRYAPPSLLLFRPFAWLSLPQAQLAWYLVQFASFGAGFCFLFLALRRILPAKRRTHPLLDPLWITSACVLFILRYCLDTFTIGQVSSIMFLGFAASLYAWMSRRIGLAGIALFVPAFFKIGPGFLYLLFILAGRGGRQKRLFAWRALWAPVVVFAALSGALLAWLRSWPDFIGLWKGWVAIVLADSVYYDASHYGSQSIKSALLRLVKGGMLSASFMDAAYPWLIAGGILAICLVWALRSPRTVRARGHFYCLGLFAYLWFMPETFKYGFTVLAFPVALLLSAPRKDRPLKATLLAAFLTLSAAGKDLMPDALFFGIQQASLPLFMTFALAALVLRELWRESVPSYLSGLLFHSSTKLGPWEIVPPAMGTLEATLLYPLPLEAHIELNAQVTLSSLREAAQYFTHRNGASFEILLIPYGERVSELHPLLQAIRSQAIGNLSISPPPAISGRGSALRSGFLRSRGKRIFLVHPEQPCESSFFEQASRGLDHGYALVRANRRMPESFFRIPVRLLPMVYGRHRLGLLFNRLVRALLPITTTDTHSGTLAMSRALAMSAFAVQSSPEFLFDLELSLVAVAQGFREMDLPFKVQLTAEKKPKRMLREVANILFGLPLLGWRYRRGCYSPFPEVAELTADDWGLSPGINRGTLELARLGVIRRVSVMANCRYASAGLRELAAIPKIEIGLHFNLTYGENALQHSRPHEFLLRWMNPFQDRSRLVEQVRQELKDQLATLRSFGVNPTYLDAHHHIHLVPGMIDALADLIREAGIRRVRLPYDPGLWLTPKLPLAILAVLARSRLRKNGFEFVSCFYPQWGHFLDHGKLRSSLARNVGSEVIVHPADADDVRTLDYPDIYSSERVTEFRALRMLSLREP